MLLGPGVMVALGPLRAKNPAGEWFIPKLG